MTIRRRTTDRFFGSSWSSWRVALVALLLAASVAAKPSQKTATGKLLIASDIHFNPMADPALVPDLAAAEPDQWEAILQRSKLRGFSPYGQDSNWWLVKSALDAMVKTEPHPALILFTGDLLAHSFPKTFKSITHDNDPEHYRSFVDKTFEFMALEFRQRFPHVKILLTPGNNDEDCGDYSIGADGIFLSDTAQRARALALEGEPFVASWKALGSYVVDPPTVPGVRIVSINTVFWSNKYRPASFSQGCATVDSTAASRLFTWLESQLGEAQKAHERVWLMFHIPPGIDGWATTHPSGGGTTADGPAASSCAASIVPMWVPEWTARFDDLLGRYDSTIVGSFAGHTHADDFRVIASTAGNHQFVLIDPAVSPIYDQNPSFRIVKFGSDGALADQTTYYLTNLQEAGGEIRGRWKPEYTFSRRWKARRLEGASLAKIDNEIVNGNKERELWLKLYMVSSTAEAIPPDVVRGLYCSIGALDPLSYESCYCAAPTPVAPPHQ